MILIEKSNKKQKYNQIKGYSFLRFFLFSLCSFLALAYNRDFLNSFLPKFFPRPTITFELPRAITTKRKASIL